MSSILDRMAGAIMWHGVDKELRKQTEFIRKNCIPKAVLLLKIYKLSLGFEFHTWEGQANPGWYDIIIVGKFTRAIHEIAWILEAMYPKLTILSFIKSGDKEDIHVLNLSISHASGYRFRDCDEI